MGSCTWSDEETRTLISVWSNDAFQVRLKGSTVCSRNKDIYDTIAQEMEAAGHNKTGEMCRRKLNTLKSMYRKRDRRLLNGQRGDVTWKFWDPMNAVMQESKAPTQQVEQPTIDAHAETIGTELEDEGNADECVQSVENDGISHCMPNSDDSMSLSVRTRVTRNIESQADGRSRKRKKVENKEDRMEILLEKMMKLQEESERRHVRLEEELLSVMKQMRRDSHEIQMHIISLLPNQTNIGDKQPIADAYHGSYVFAGEDDQ